MADAFPDGPCCNCGAYVESIHVAQLCPLPARLRRARHKRFDQTAIYCGDCWGATPSLSVFVGGRVLSVNKKPPPFDDIFRCELCGLPGRHNELHGLLAYAVMVEGSITENFPLATFCSHCVETRDIRLRPDADAG